MPPIYDNRMDQVPQYNIQLHLLQVDPNMVNYLKQVRSRMLVKAHVVNNNPINSILSRNTITISLC
jgi:hypothetical protein